MSNLVNDLADDELKARLVNRGWTPRAADLGVRNREDPRIGSMLYQALMGDLPDVDESDFE